MVRVNCNQKTIPSKTKQTFLVNAGFEWYVWICVCVCVCVCVYTVHDWWCAWFSQNIAQYNFRAYWKTGEYSLLLLCYCWLKISACIGHTSTLLLFGLFKKLLLCCLTLYCSTSNGSSVAGFFDLENICASREALIW